MICNMKYPKQWKNTGKRVVKEDHRKQFEYWKCTVNHNRTTFKIHVCTIVTNTTQIFSYLRLDLKNYWRIKIFNTNLYPCVTEFVKWRQHSEWLINWSVACSDQNPNSDIWHGATRKRIFFCSAADVIPEISHERHVTWSFLNLIKLSENRKCHLWTTEKQMRRIKGRISTVQWYLDGKEA